MGAQRNAEARGGDCAGVGRTRRKGGGVPRRAGRGRFSPGRRGQGAVSGDAAGASGARRAGAFLPGGGKPGAGGAWPREPHKGRVSGATARDGHVSWRRSVGGIRRLSGADVGKARAGAAVYGGRAGYSRGRWAYCRAAAGGGPGRAKNALSCAACVGLRATGGKDGSGVGEKARFRYIKEAFFAGARALSIQR